MTLYAVNFLWILSTGIGLALALYGFNEARLDKEALNILRKNGGKKVIADATVMQQAALAIGQFAFFVPGILSLFGPMPQNPVSLAAGLLLVGSWAMAVSSAIGIWGNKRAMEVDESRDEMRDEARDATRDEGRDEGRDPVRDAARDLARDKEKDVQ